MNIKTRIINESAKWHASVLNGQPIRNVIDFCEVTTSYFRRNRPDEWIFRGEPFLYDLPLTPSMYRFVGPPSRLKYPGKNITDEEVLEIINCQDQVRGGMIQDKYLKAFIPIMHTEDVNWLPLSRHFGFKTRLLDVTLNPLVALYFACRDLHTGPIDENDDAFVYAFLKGSFRPVDPSNGEQHSFSDFPPIPISYLELYDVDKHHPSNISELPYIFEPSIPQERMQAQSGRFLFWKSISPLLCHPDTTQLIPIRIDASEKQTILNELSAFGIMEQTLFPDIV